MVYDVTTLHFENKDEDDLKAAKRKASGLNINLWMGLGMLALGLLFLLWWRVRPLHRELPPPD